MLTAKQIYDSYTTAFPSCKRMSLAYVQGVLDSLRFATGEGKHSSILNRYKTNCLEFNEYTEGLAAGNDIWIERNNFIPKRLGINQKIKRNKDTY
jgi:hypothetical protein